MTHPVSDNSDAHLNPRDLPACSTLLRFCFFDLPVKGPGPANPLYRSVNPF